MFVFFLHVVLCDTVSGLGIEEGLHGRLCHFVLDFESELKNIFM